MAEDRDHPNGAGGFTRRGLIKGLATTAVATATAGATALAEERAKTDAAAGGGASREPHAERRPEEGRLRAAHDARGGAAGHVGSDGDEGRLRPRRLRSVHRAARRRSPSTPA